MLLMIKVLNNLIIINLLKLLKLTHMSLDLRLPHLHRKNPIELLPKVLILKIN